MTKEDIRDFSMKITQCSKTGLVVITYEIIENYLNSAIECHKKWILRVLDLILKRLSSF